MIHNDVFGDSDPNSPSGKKHAAVKGFIHGSGLTEDSSARALFEAGQARFSKAKSKESKVELGKNLLQSMQMYDATNPEFGEGIGGWGDWWERDNNLDPRPWMDEGRALGSNPDDDAIQDWLERMPQVASELLTEETPERSGTQRPLPNLRRGGLY
jgi:hypothetical protein